MALANPAPRSDFGLRHAGSHEVFDDFCPVHSPIITQVIGHCKHHREFVFDENQTMETLAQRLTKKREEAKLSQSELARRARLKNQSIIAMLESGARKTSSYIPQIANALGVESLWLSSGIGPERRGDARTYELSEVAMKIAIAANAMPEAYQEALLHLITLERVKMDSLSVINDQSIAAADQPHRDKLR